MDVRVLVLMLGLAAADVSVMKDVTLGFGEALDKCRQESQLTEEMMEQFFHFWSEELKLERRELGCALHCMSHHFSLLTPDSRMHHENTHNFIKSFPNGEAISQQLVELVHGCEQQWDGEADQCWRLLRVADCFRAGCRARGLAPAAELMLAEFILQASE